MAGRERDRGPWKPPLHLIPAKKPSIPTDPRNSDPSNISERAVGSVDLQRARSYPAEHTPHSDFHRSNTTIVASRAAANSGLLHEGISPPPSVKMKDPHTSPFRETQFSPTRMRHPLSRELKSDQLSPDHRATLSRLLSRNEKNKRQELGSKEEELLRHAEHQEKIYRYLEKRSKKKAKDISAMEEGEKEKEELETEGRRAEQAGLVRDIVGMLKQLGKAADQRRVERHLEGGNTEDGEDDKDEQCHLNKVSSSGDSPSLQAVGDSDVRAPVESFPARNETERLPLNLMQLSIPQEFPKRVRQEAFSGTNSSGSGIHKSITLPHWEAISTGRRNMESNPTPKSISIIPTPHNAKNIPLPELDDIPTDSAYQPRTETAYAPMEFIDINARSCRSSESSCCGSDKLKESSSSLDSTKGQVGRGERTRNPSEPLSTASEVSKTPSGPSSPKGLTKSEKYGNVIIGYEVPEEKSIPSLTTGTTVSESSSSSTVGDIYSLYGSSTLADSHFSFEPKPKSRAVPGRGFNSRRVLPRTRPSLDGDHEIIREFAQRPEPKATHSYKASTVSYRSNATYESKGLASMRDDEVPEEMNKDRVEEEANLKLSRLLDYREKKKQSLISTTKLPEEIADLYKRAVDANWDALLLESDNEANKEKNLPSSPPRSNAVSSGVASSRISQDSQREGLEERREFSFEKDTDLSLSINMNKTLDQDSENQDIGSEPKILLRPQRKKRYKFTASKVKTVEHRVSNLFATGVEVDTLPEGPLHDSSVRLTRTSTASSDSTHFELASGSIEVYGISEEREESSSTLGLVMNLENESIPQKKVTTKRHKGDDIMPPKWTTSSPSRPEVNSQVTDFKTPDRDGYRAFNEGFTRQLIHSKHSTLSTDSPSSIYDDNPNFPSAYSSPSIFTGNQDNAYSPMDPQLFFNSPIGSTFEGGSFVPSPLQEREVQTRPQRQLGNRLAGGRKMRQPSFNTATSSEIEGRKPNTQIETFEEPSATKPDMNSEYQTAPGTPKRQKSEPPQSQATSKHQKKPSPPSGSKLNMFLKSGSVGRKRGNNTSMKVAYEPHYYGTGRKTSKHLQLLGLSTAEDPIAGIRFDERDGGRTTDNLFDGFDTLTIAPGKGENYKSGANELARRHKEDMKWEDLKQ